jgi:hypothetical protein
VHKQFDPDICRTFLSWQTAKVKNGTWKGYQTKANNTNVAPATSTHLPSVTHAEINSLQQ